MDHQRIFHGLPGVYLASRDGLAAVGLALPRARVDLRTYDHDLELSGLVIDLEREFGEGSVSTEREMRATDTAIGTRPQEGPAFAVPLTGARGQLQLTPVGHPRLHFPDAAVRLPQEPSVLAVELERTPKGRARLRAILSAYVAAKQIRQVKYLAADNRVFELIREEVARLHAERLVEVTRVTETDPARAA